MQCRPLSADLSLKFHGDHRNRPFIEALSVVSAGVGVTTHCVARDLEHWGQHEFDAASLMRETFRMIDRVDVVVIELSEKGVGIGIEAGYASARGIPIVVLHPTGSDVSTTLRGIATAVLSYDDERPLASQGSEVRRIAANE
jgi:hypothetical protein